MKGAIMLSGGGSGKLFAAIGVTYPAGSTLTCTNGTSTLKAKTTTGQWVFAIPKAGTWTVTSTANDGSGDSASETVEITTEGQSVSVELAYGFWLYKDGVQNVEWVALNLHNASVTFGADKIITTGAGSWGEHGIHTKEKINLSGYKTLHLYGRVTNKIVDDTAREVQKLGLVEATTDPTSIAYTANYSSYVTIGTELKEYVLDVSAINEEYYVAIGGVNDTEVNQIWLE